MSSPFNIFRKRQRAILVVVGVLCIFVFTVGDIVLQWWQPDVGIGRAEDTVVTWKGGSLSEDELAALRMVHRQTITYLDRLMAETVKREGTPKGFGVTQNDPGISRDDSELRMVRTLLLAEEAEKMGMEVPDQAIIQFLAELTDHTLSSPDLAAILREATQGRLTRDKLFNNLRRELLARNYLRLAAAGDVMTPDDAWDYYNRLTRRITTSLVEFNAADYLEQAPQPKPAEVEALYEKYKDQFSAPGSPEPGFKQRTQFQFGYFKADFDKFMEEEKPKISAEEVQKHYEENKDRYTVPDLPELPDAKTPTEAPEGEAPATGETEKPETEKPETEKPETETPESPAPASDEKTEPAAPESSEPSADENQCGQDVELNQPATGDDVQEPAADSAAPAKTEAEASDAPAESETPAKSETTAEPQTPTETEPAKTDEEPAKADAETPKTEEGAAEEPKKEVKYRPLAEVEDDIRRELARPKAQERIKSALREAARVVERYGRSYRAYAAAQAENRGEGRKPEQPDFEQVAKRLGLIYDETPVVNELTVGETELGQTGVFSFTGGNFQQIPFAYIAMQTEEAPLYQTHEISGGQNQFLYWPTKITPSRTPPLDEIRDEVVRTWRLQKAFDIALQEAKQAAEKVRKAEGQPLHEVLKLEEAEILKPPAFSWMTTGQSLPFGGGGQASPSDVEGVDTPGDEFFQEAFSLEEGGVGVAPNYPKTAAYVIRVEGEAPPVEDRRDSFIGGGLQFNPGVRQIASMEQQRKVFSWLEDLEKEWGLDWQRPARASGML